MLFEKLGLNQHLCQHLMTLGFDKPTLIQEQAIPLLLQGQDVIASAQTGSGKTASFLFPLLHILTETPLKARMPRAIIMEPTRELAQQVFDQFVRFSPNTLKAALLVGGESMVQQDRILKTNPDVLIVTPGRLLDLCEREKLMLFGIRYVVIDEADRMLDMGFLPDVTRIMEKIPLSRQTMLFSATFDEEIKKLTHQFMLAPKTVIAARAGSTVESIEQYSINVDEKQKRIATRHLLRTYGVQNDVKVPSIIFCNKKRDMATLVSSLKRHGFATDSLHGDLQQSARNQTLERFRSGDIHVLVASDIAARGLDVLDLGLVINFNVPINAEDYVHRIGRTGRAGKTGFAFTLVEKKDKKLWKAVESLTQQTISEFIIPDDVLNTLLKDITPEKVKKENNKHVVQGMTKKLVHNEKSYAHSQDIINFKGFGDCIPAFFKQESYRAFFALSESNGEPEQNKTTDENHIPVESNEKKSSRAKSRNRSKKDKAPNVENVLSSNDNTHPNTENMLENVVESDIKEHIEEEQHLKSN